MSYTLARITDQNVGRSRRFSSAWSKDGFQEALKVLLSEANTLFDDMRKKLSDIPQLKKMLYELLYEGQTFRLSQAYR